MNIFSPEDREIYEISDSPGLSYDEGDKIQGFFSNNNKINYFPRGIDEFFKNIIMIYIEFGRLKEIKQADLKPFVKLEELSLGNNDIHVLEYGLFEFNPNLKLISFYNSPIFHIDSNVFNNLEELSNLWLLECKCIDEEATNDPIMVERIIHILQSKCYNLDIIEIQNNLKELEYYSKNLNDDNFDDFFDKLEKYENNFQNSQFSDYEIFKIEFQILKNVQKNSQNVQNITSSFLSTINSLSVLSQKIDNFECKTDQNPKNGTESENHGEGIIQPRFLTDENEISEIRNKLSSLEAKIDRQNSKLNKILKKIEKNNILKNKRHEDSSDEYL